jgi:hypothetical protein
MDILRESKNWYILKPSSVAEIISGPYETFGQRDADLAYVQQNVSTHTGIRADDWLVGKRHGLPVVLHFRMWWCV